MNGIFKDDWDFILGPGSMFERLRRDPRVNGDPHIYHAVLLYDDEMREFFASIVREYADIAQKHGLPYLATTATWRTSHARIAASRCAGLPVNRDAAAFACAIRDSYGPGAAPIVVSGLLGPMGDAYKPEEAPDRGEAHRFHAPQVADLADTKVDCLAAKTLPALKSSC